MINNGASLATSNVADGQPFAVGYDYHVMAVAGIMKLKPVAVSASSSAIGLQPSRAIDADPNTQWSSGNINSDSETLTLKFGQRFSFDHMAIKTGILAGLTMYRADVSDDGTTWRDAGGTYRNTTWNSETKPLSGEGRFLRIRFLNDSFGSRMSRFSIFDLQVFGKANPSAIAQTMTLHAVPQSVPYGPAVSFAGPIGTVINTATNAFDNTAKGLKFPAMIFTSVGRLGIDSTRVTPLNAPFVESDLGNPGSATFLDTLGGLGDNSGSWVFTHRNSNGVFNVEASAKTNVTTWDPKKVSFLDLGPKVRRWHISGKYTTQNNAQFDAPVVVVYTRPDGVHDFTFALGSIFPPGEIPTTIDMAGFVFAFFLTSGSGNPSPDDAQVTLSSEN
jgi:hypothetical protein